MATYIEGAFNSLLVSTAINDWPVQRMPSPMTADQAKNLTAFDLSPQYRKGKPADYTKSLFYQPVIKKQLFTSLDSSLSKDAYPVITVNHHNFCIAVWIY